MRRGAGTVSSTGPSTSQRIAAARRSGETVYELVWRARPLVGESTIHLSEAAAVEAAGQRGTVDKIRRAKKVPTQN